MTDFIACQYSCQYGGIPSNFAWGYAFGAAIRDLRAEQLLQAAEKLDFAIQLTGSTTWVEFDGTSVTRKVWDGRAWIEECETDSPTGHIEGLTLRLYNPQTHQWRLYWANSKDGAMGGPPNVREFKNGRGEFYCQDRLNDRAILIRYVWSDITPNSAHFEQSFSDDGGKTWEVNWITNQTRVN